MTRGQRSALGRPTFALGCICAALLPLVLIEMALQLANMPEEQWRQGHGVQLPAGQFDLRMMAVICPSPIGWLGGWGYLLTFLWVPVACYSVWRAIREGLPFRRRELVLVALVPTLMVAIELIFHLTPLRHGYPLL